MTRPVLASRPRWPRAARSGWTPATRTRPTRAARTGWTPATRARSTRAARTRTAGAAIVAALALAACGSGTPDLRVDGEPAASAARAGSSQVVLTLVNDGDGDDTLVGASTPQAVAVEIHRTELDGGRAQMGTLEEIDIPAGGQVAFRPGQEHLMLVVPDDTVVEGGTLELVLEFDRSDPITVEAPVVDLVDLAEGSFEDAPPGDA